MEASTGIEPVYTDLQSAASPLRQLASRGVGTAISFSGVSQVAHLFKNTIANIAEDHEICQRLP